MEIILKEIPHNPVYNNYKTYVELNFEKDDPILIESMNRAKEMVRNVNPHDPSGNIRNDDELLSKNYQGCLAELITKKLLENAIVEKRLNSTVEDSIGFEVDVDGSAQIDLKVNHDGKQHHIEVRSSCVRNGTEFGITTGHFHIIGWYVTNTKQKEIKKDFYAMILFPFDDSKTLNKFTEGLTVHFVGGATKAMLQGSLGSETTMRQIGAVYRGIKPICAGLDAKKFIDEILS